MRLSGREDIGLGIEEVFAAATDVAFLERQLLRRGIEIVRTDTLGETGLGAAWSAKTAWNGRPFPVDVEVTEWTPPGSAALLARSRGLTGDVSLALAALSRNDTRLQVTLTFKASSFRDRMFLNSVALAKSRLSRQFSDLVCAFAKSVETRAARV